MALHVQNQIRNNAEEVNGFFQDMVKWEQDIKVKDKKIIQKKMTRQAARSAPSTRPGAGTVAVTTTGKPADKSTSAASHTYDVGYKKWEKIKITESDELEVDDKHDMPPPTPDPSTTASTNLTPALLAALPGNAPTVSQTQVPKALGKASNVDIETYERERGNAEFKTGNFANAIKCYTKCLGLKPKNYVAFSNRAMAYLKQKEHHKAETDCSCALRIAPDHVKSLLRRASARAQLGKYRAGIQDLRTAQALDPTNKQVHQELKKALDSLKSAASKAPGELLSTMWEEDYQQALLAEDDEEELGDLSSRVEEVGLEEEEQIAKDKEIKKTTSIPLMAGPELPLPNQGTQQSAQQSTLQIDSKDSSPLSRGPIDMTKMAEEVEREVEEEISSTQSKDDQGGGRDHIPVVEINEDNDGEWVVLTSPEKRSTRMQIVEADDDGDDEEDVGQKEEQEQEDRKVHHPETVSEKHDEVLDSSIKKQKSKSAADVSKKTSEKKKKSKKKSSATGSGAALYSIERSLLSCKGNDQLLTEFLDSLDEKKFLSPPSKSKGGGGAAAQTLEVDVVVDLLLAVGRCFGERGQQWTRVLKWFEGVAARSGVASFSFVTAMLSSQQKDALRRVLSAVEEYSLINGGSKDGQGDGAGLTYAERIESVRSLYEL